MDPLAPTTIAGAALILLGIYYIVFWWSYWKMNYKGKLVTGGPYTIVRHPYYFGFLGLALVSWAVIISQIKSEEEELIKKYGNKYKEYQERIRWRLIPGVY
jgi:protein-S-isoprenylcysteine O-methyltransferase Ste14